MFNSLGDFFERILFVLDFTHVHPREIIVRHQGITFVANPEFGFLKFGKTASGLGTGVANGFTAFLAVMLRGR